MSKGISSDVSKIILYFIGSFLLAALIAPWIYNTGHFIADIARREESNILFEYLGPHAERAEFAVYFKRALVLSALLLLPPLLFLLRLSRTRPALAPSAFSEYLPEEIKNAPQGQPLVWKTSLAPLHLIIGFCVAGGLLFLCGQGLLAAGFFEPKTDYSWVRVLKKATTAAIGASLLEELLFRGLLLGIFLRSFRPKTAILSLSFIFAALHFLQPPDGFIVKDPRASFAGFEMLGLLMQRFLTLTDLIYEFITLFIIGIILASARYQTASLWLPLGLHAGWVFSYKVFNQLYHRLPEKSANLLLGDDLKEGLIPFLTLLITGVLLSFYYRFVKRFSLTSDSNA